METCAELIRKAEGKWISPVTEFINTQFRNVHLPSHDLSHHQRVWRYATGLLLQLSAIQPVDESLIDNTLIASFFHDIGLTKTPSKEHGLHSRMLCEQFFKAHPTLLYPQLEDALLAIEKHDDKAYAPESAIKGTAAMNLLTIVSIADDFDAFGAIGVFRYAEIYFLRGISVAQMPGMVIPNLDARFQHLEHAFPILSALAEMNNGRYRFTRKFYSDFRDFDLESGPARVVELFRKYILDKKMSLDRFIQSTAALSLDDYGKEYFGVLKHELDQFES